MWNWDLRRATSSGFGSRVSTPNPIHEGLSYHERMAKPLPDEHDDDEEDDDSVRYHLTNTKAAESDKYMMMNPPFMGVNPNALSTLEDESSSRLSGSVHVDSSSRGSSLIDLKLGRVGECQNSRGAPIVSPSDQSSTPPKRARFGPNLPSAAAAPYCQVYGCNKDLSSSKDYHKRHKVCELHSKTAKVIVNGIEQRFCQQCSRFHLLAEFDDGKRSCRKRLAGHNERRRKPQVGGKAARLIQSYNAAAGFGNGRLQETGLTSFICQDILPGSLTYPQKHESNHWSRPVKVEEDSSNNYMMSAVSGLIIPITGSHLHSKFPSSHSFEKMFPPFHDSVVTSAAAGSIFSESNNQFPHDVGGSSNSGSSSCSLPQNVDFINFDPASTIQGLDSGSCALSLLSSQSQSSSGYSSGIPSMAHHHHHHHHHHHQSLIFTNNNNSSSSSQYDHMHQQVSSSAKLVRFGSHVSAAGASTSTEASHLNPMFLSHLDDDTDGIYQRGPRFMDEKDGGLSSEDGGHTIDLLQLSSQLHRVEREKQLKQEAEAFCCPRII